jgi:hypothetical protein
VAKPSNDGTIFAITLLSIQITSPTSVTPVIRHLINISVYGNTFLVENYKNLKSEPTNPKRIILKKWQRNPIKMNRYIHCTCMN